MIFPDSELPINSDGSAFHLHLKPEQITDRIILVGDPGRVDMISGMLDSVRLSMFSREFKTIIGTYKGTYACS